MRSPISLFLFKIRILIYSYLVILLNSHVNLASLVEEQEISKKQHILEEDKNKREILEEAQEIWVREKNSQKSKGVFIGGEDIIVKLGNGITWVSANGELTCFPTNIILKKILERDQFPYLEFQRNIPNIDLTQQGIILDFLNKQNVSVGFVKMFMLKKEINHQIYENPSIQRIWLRPQVMQ